MDPLLPVMSLLRIPRQRRAIEMVHALLDATILVLQRDGMVGFTTNRVAEAAGASVGSLYQYFANKEALVAGVVERGVLAAEDQIRDLITVELPPEQLARQLLTGVIGSLRPYSTLLAEVLGSAPMLSRGGIMGILEPRLLDLTRDYMLVSSERVRPVGGPAALYVMVSGTAFTLLKWLAEQPRHISQEALVEVLSRQMTAHLTSV